MVGASGCDGASPPALNASSRSAKRSMLADVLELGVKPTSASGKYLNEYVGIDPAVQHDRVFIIERIGYPGAIPDRRGLLTRYQEIFGEG